MYSYEINALVQARNHRLDSRTYLDMCDSSPQIKRVKYDPYSNNFELWTNDGLYCTFQVYPSET